MEPAPVVAGVGSVAETAKSIRDDDAKTMRYLFATMHKLWPTETSEQIDARRACLAIMVTKDNEQRSWKGLNTAQLFTVANRLKDIENGAITMEPTVGGYVFSLKTTQGTVRKLYVTKDGSSYRHWTQERDN